MPENKTLDPFKPVQPRIPGVPSRERQANRTEIHPDEINQAPPVIGPPPRAADGLLTQPELLWVGLILMGALATALFLFRGGHKPATASLSVSTAPVSAASNPASAPSAHVAPIDSKIPMGPGPIAETSQLAKPWSAKRFYFHDSISGKIVPAMVVRLPAGTFWGFSLREPYGDCELEFVTDSRKLRHDYGFAANYPMVGDPCNKTVFDLMHYGNAPGGLVRGEIEQGPGWRPPMAIEIRTQDKQIVAVRMEP
jgi:hypothetical protein